jgi:hypothetical protein
MNPFMAYTPGLYSATSCFRRDGESKLQISDPCGAAFCGMEARFAQQSGQIAWVDLAMAVKLMSLVMTTCIACSVET